MLIAAIAWTLLLLSVVYKMDRNPCFPAWIFLGSWLLLLCGIQFAGSLFYEPIGGGYLIYGVGAFAFFLGAAIVRAVKLPVVARTEVSGGESVARHNVIRAVLMLLVLCFPAYAYLALQASGGEDAPLLSRIVLIRQKNVELSHQGLGGLGLIDNLVVLAEFMALIAFMEFRSMRGGKAWLGAAAASALLYGIMTGSKTILVTLPLQLTFLWAIRRRGVSPWQMAAGGALAALLFIIGLFAINFVSDGGGGRSPRQVAAVVASYWMGGMVAFDRIASGADDVEPVQTLDRPVRELARRLGLAIPASRLHADYIDIGPGMNTNVYTIFFTYGYRTSLFHTFYMMLLIGFVTTFVYRIALSGVAVAGLFYAVLSTKLVLSFSSEHFVMAWNPLAKLLCLGVLIYVAVPRIYQLLPKKGAGAP